MLRGPAISAVNNRFQSISPQTKSMLTGRVEVDGLRYPQTTEYTRMPLDSIPSGQKISIAGFTQEGTTVVKRRCVSEVPLDYPIRMRGSISRLSEGGLGRAMAIGQ
jgi:hypothetical protein